MARRESEFEIVNWSKYQDTRRPGPKTWCKLHAAMLDDPTIRSLEDHQKWLWVALLMLAARTENRFSCTRGYLKGVLACTTNPSIQPFLNLGLVRRCAPRVEKKEEKERGEQSRKDLRGRSSSGASPGPVALPDGRSTDPDVARSKQDQANAVEQIKALMAAGSPEDA